MTQPATSRGDGTPVQRPSSTTGRRALALYGNEAPSVRLRTALRWWTCPFPAVADRLPPTGRILEIGCGHGLFSAFLALGSAGRQVTGIDVDAEKVRTAQRVTACLDRLAFSVGAPGRLPAGPWDAIAVVDVLYLMGREAQRELVGEACEALAPGATLVVKEMSTTPRAKFELMRAQEALSVRVLRITAGEGLVFVPPAELAGWLTSAGLAVERVRVDRGYPHPHHLIAGTRRRH